MWKINRAFLKQQIALGKKSSVFISYNITGMYAKNLLMQCLMVFACFSVGERYEH